MFYPIIMIIKKKLSFINIKTIKLSIKNEIEIEIGTWDLQFLFEIDFSRSQEEFIPASQTSMYTHNFHYIFQNFLKSHIRIWILIYCLQRCLNVCT
jgi:hypothetical protein